MKLFYVFKSIKFNTSSPIVLGTYRTKDEATVAAMANALAFDLVLSDFETFTSSTGTVVWIEEIEHENVISFAEKKAERDALKQEALG